MQDDDRMTMYEACLYHSKADRALRLVVVQCLEKHHVTMMEWLLLGIVGDGPSVGRNMSALSKILDVTMPQVTALTSHLLEQRLVKQKSAKHDRRNRFVVVTGKGRNLLEDVEEDLRQVMHDWMKPIPDQLKRGYLETVKLISGLSQQPPDEAPLPETTIAPTGRDLPVSVRVAGEEV